MRLLMRAPSITGQSGLVALLLLLYTVFALPVGLIFGSIPFILKEHTTFTSLSIFSLTTLPYALKLLFAPVIDSVSLWAWTYRVFGANKMVRISMRASWILPALFCISVLMYVYSSYIEYWTLHGMVGLLTPLGFVIISLVAIGEIAIDGWSVELLSDEYRTYASVCQAIGPSIGYTLTFTLFLPLNNPEFARNFLHRSTGPLLTLDGVSKITATVALSVAVLVLSVDAFVLNGNGYGNGNAYKNVNADEDPRSESGDELVSLTEDGRMNSRNGNGNSNSNRTSKAYEIFRRILRLKHVQRLVVVLLVCKWGFSSFDAAAPLKLIEDGFPKESIASIAVIQSVTQLLGTVLVGRYLSLVQKGNPVSAYTNLFLVGYFFRFVFSLSGPVIVYAFKNQMGGKLTAGFFALCASIMTLYGLFAYCCMFVPLAAYFLHITSSSTLIAGSYLTLLHTAYNIGSYWPKTITLGLIDKLTIYDSRNCSTTLNANTFGNLTTSSMASSVCPVQAVSGYYIVSLIEAVYTVGVGIFIYFQLRKFDKLPLVAWSVPEMGTSEQ